MSLLDKVKKVATDAAEVAKKGTEKAKDKVEQMQIKKKLDGNAEQLGYLIYRERRQGTPAGADAEKLMDEMAEYERLLAEAEADDAGADDAGSGDPGIPPTPAG
jgi:hypothetical protein